jgi:hypothetical protein
MVLLFFALKITKIVTDDKGFKMCCVDANLLPSYNNRLFD